MVRKTRNGGENNFFADSKSSTTFKKKQKLFRTFYSIQPEAAETTLPLRLFSPATLHYRLPGDAVAWRKLDSRVTRTAEYLYSINDGVECSIFQDLRKHDDKYVVSC